jgi:hypothetical protein
MAPARVSAVSPGCRSEKTKRNLTTSRAEVGARVVGVESGTVLWISKFGKDSRGEASRALAEVSKAVADAFPKRKSAKKDEERRKDTKSKSEKEPKKSTK